jgi:hypothetical protein
VKRNALNYAVDMGMLLSFAAVLMTGIAKYPLLLRLLARNGVYLPSSEITLIHEWGGAVLAVFTLVHLVLHWRWMMSATRRLWRSGKGKEAGP